MYSTPTTSTTGLLGGGATITGITTLPHTGFGLMTGIVAVSTLVAAGSAMLSLTARIRRNAFNVVAAPAG